MAYLDYTRRNNQSALETTLCLTNRECRLLLPVIKSALKKAKLSYEKYSDIQDSGEASVRQQNALYKAEEEMEILDSVLSVAQEWIQREDGKQ